MNDSIVIIPDAQALSPIPPLRYRALMRLPCFGLCPDHLTAMRVLEIAVATRLMSWLNAQPSSPADTLTALDPVTLWDVTGAATWIHPRDARSPRDFLWQFALIRLSRYLACGHWEVFA